MKTINGKIIVLGVLFAALTMGLTTANASIEGKKMPKIMIKDAEDKPAQIPGLGKKVVSIIYADIQAADVNDPLADAIKAAKFDESKYEGIGVANLKDSPVPNFIIRSVVRGKIKKYNSTILTDDDLVLPKKLGLGDVNNESVVIIIGKDQKVKYYKKGVVKGAEIQKVLEIIKNEINAG